MKRVTRLTIKCGECGESYYEGEAPASDAGVEWILARFNRHRAVCSNKHTIEHRLKKLGFFLLSSVLYGVSFGVADCIGLKPRLWQKMVYFVAVTILIKMGDSLGIKEKKL